MPMNLDDSRLRPHPSVRSGIEGNKQTAFTDIEFFEGGDDDYTTLEKIASDEFNQIIEEVTEVGKMSMPDFFEAFDEMLEMEKHHRKELEALALKKVVTQFGLPKSLAKRIYPKLVKKIKIIEGGELYIPPNYDLEFTKEETEIIKKNVEKRKIQNALIMGAGFRAHTTFQSIKEDLDVINPELFPLYEKTMPNVSLSMWEHPIEDFMDKVTVMGASELKRGEKQKVEAIAESVIFPILLHETAKVAMELLFANYLIGLSKDYGTQVAAEIINQSDIFEEEIWMKRIGPSLWDKLHNLIDYIIIHEKEGDYTLVSYLLSDISKMSPDNFIEFMNLVVYNGKEAIKKVTLMIAEIEDDLKYDVTSSFEEMSLYQLAIEFENAQDEDRYEDAQIIFNLIKNY